MSNPASPLEIHVHDAGAIDALLKDAPGIERGTQSQIGLIDLPGVPDETLLKRMGVNKGLGHDEALRLQGDLITYREQLTAAGWNIPPLHDSVLAKVTDEWQIWEFEQFITGTNASALLRLGRSNTMKRYVMKQALRTMSQYIGSELPDSELYGRPLTTLPHGVDLKPANIVIDNLGVMWMVDTFGPKAIDEHGSFVSYNSKLDTLPMNALKAICATRQGAVLRFLRKTQEQWLSSGSSNEEEFIEDVDYALAFTPLPAHETDDIIVEINNGYPWLNAVYANAFKS
jgi:hypothetical protein